MGNEVVWGELRELVLLHVNPAEGLEVSKVLVLGELGREVDDSRGPPLRWHNEAANLLDEGVLWWRHAVHVRCDLRAEVCDAYEAAEEVLGKMYV